MASDGQTGFPVKSRPVIGAFALYPGFFDQSAGENPYNEAIHEVGIGAFPLLPGNENRWLWAFLEECFGKKKENLSGTCIYTVTEESDLGCHLLHESIRIPPTGLNLTRYNDLTLLATPGGGRDDAYVARLHEGKAEWYHIPVSTTEKHKIQRHVMRELRYCAIAVTDEKKQIVEFIYEVKSIEIKKRRELTKEQTGKDDYQNQNNYWLIKLGTPQSVTSSIEVPGSARRFRFRLTSKDDVFTGRTWDKLSDRYPSSLLEN